MRLATIRVLRRRNNVAHVCALLVCLSGADSILNDQRYWLGCGVIGVGLTLLTLAINQRADKGSRRAMPARFEELAQYNAVMHKTEMVDVPGYFGDKRIVAVDVPRSTYPEEHHARMVLLQAEYDVWYRGELERKYPDGCLIDMPGGGVMVFPDEASQVMARGNYLIAELLKTAKAPDDHTAHQVKQIRIERSTEEGNA